MSRIRMAIKYTVCKLFFIRDHYQGELKQGGAESKAHRFFGKDELPANLNPRQKAFIQDWADEKKLPIMR